MYRKRKIENVNWCRTRIEITRNKSSVKYPDEMTWSFHTAHSTHPSFFLVLILNLIHFVLFSFARSNISRHTFNQNTREQTDCLIESNFITKNTGWFYPSDKTKQTTNAKIETSTVSHTLGNKNINRIRYKKKTIFSFLFSLWKDKY